MDSAPQPLNDRFKCPSLGRSGLYGPTAIFSRSDISGLDRSKAQVARQILRVLVPPGVPMGSPTVMA